MILQKLFYKQPHTYEFSATLTDIIHLSNQQDGLILEETAFYPEGGGQPCDIGHINHYPVIDVQERDGQIVHIINGKVDVALLHQKVNGIVNWQRRFDHMQQHSGQHILSAVLYNTFQAETVGFHMGSESCQIDVTMSEFTLAIAKQVEYLVNERIFSHQCIETKFLTQDEIPLFPIRKIPTKEIENARLVYINDFDYSLCCGTHVANTGAIGLLKIRQWERKNNIIRLDFVCGKRALEDYQFKNALTNVLSNTFSSPITSLENTIQQAVVKSEALAKELVRTKQELYKLVAAQLIMQAATVGTDIKIIAHIMYDASIQEVNMLAKELLQYPQIIILLAAENAEQTKIQLNFSTNLVTTNIHMGQHLKSILATLKGKGGGSAISAQGGCAYSDQFANVLEETKINIMAEL